MGAAAAASPDPQPLPWCPPSDGGSASSRPSQKPPAAHVHARAQLQPGGGDGGGAAQRRPALSAQVPEPQLPHLPGAGVLQPGECLAPPTSTCTSTCTSTEPPSSLILQIITMTHCSCFLCQTCFKTFFSSAIKEKSVDQLVCPQCGKPEVRGQGRMEELMDYFSLLDTQVSSPGASVGPVAPGFRLPGLCVCADSPLPAASRARAVSEETQRSSPAGDAQLQMVFSRKHVQHLDAGTSHTHTHTGRDQPSAGDQLRVCVRARVFQCSFGLLHEADRLRMDCPSCQKSTCSQCRSPVSHRCDGGTIIRKRNQNQILNPPLCAPAVVSSA